MTDTATTQFHTDAGTAFRQKVSFTSRPVSDKMSKTYHVNLTASSDRNTASQNVIVGRNISAHVVSRTVPSRNVPSGTVSVGQKSNRQSIQSNLRTLQGQYRPVNTYQQRQNMRYATATGRNFSNVQTQPFANVRTQQFANIQTRNQPQQNRNAQNRAYMESQSAANRAADAQAIKEAIATPVKAASAIRKRTVTRLHTIISERRYSFPVSIVLIALLFTFLILAIVTTSVQISEVTREKSALERSYNSLVADENELRMLLETRDDLRVVEEVATEELGMVKKDQVQRYYLSSFKEDKIELVNEAAVKQSNFWSGFADMFGGILDRIRLFFSR